MTLLQKTWHGTEDRNDDPQSRETDSKAATIKWVLGAAAILVVLALVVWQCMKRRKITKRAKTAHQDMVLNLPLATPFHGSSVPYAAVVDIAATAPDHDELLPATTSTGPHSRR